MQRADRRIKQAYSLYEVLRDETFVAFTRPEARGAVTALAYAQHPARYSPGSPHFESGLFEWEQTALRVMKVDARSRVLIGGAGGGRELSCLAEVAGEVAAFEPVTALFEAACHVAAGRRNVSVYQGSYGDFVDAAKGRGSLVPVVREYDAVILGRGSFGHVTDEGDQLDLLCALRSSSPRAPLLLSFTLRLSDDDVGDSTRARRIVRGVFGRVGGRMSSPGLRYERGRGFVYHFTEDEIRRLSRRAGYQVAHLGKTATALRPDKPPAYAVLVPETPRPRL